MVGILQEANGAWSMRRVLALFLSIAAVGLFVLAAVKASIYAVYGGGGCLLGVIVLLFFTTWGDIKGIVLAVKGIDAEKKPNDPGAAPDTVGQVVP